MSKKNILFLFLALISFNVSIYAWDNSTSFSSLAGLPTVTHTTGIALYNFIDENQMSWAVYSQIWAKSNDTDGINFPFTTGAYAEMNVTKGMNELQIEYDCVDNLVGGKINIILDDIVIGSTPILSMQNQSGMYTFPVNRTGVFTLRLEFSGQGNFLIKGVKWNNKADNGTVDVHLFPENKKWTISPYLLGLHTVYYNDPDKAYSDGSLSQWALENHVGTMRFPGGSVVKYWDWENPSGTATGDPYDPNWDKVVASANSWMSYDEYVRFVKASQIAPLFGVNYRSGYLYGRTQDGIDRAVRMVRKAKQDNLGGAYWYIGNEDMYDVGGVTTSANLFVQYSSAMKKEDPAIKIFWNDNGITPTSLKTYLALVGNAADGVEFHGKWPFGGAAPLPDRTYTDWKTEVPLVEQKMAETWREKIKNLRIAASEAGYPNLLMANNEFGLGQEDFLNLGFNRYSVGLLLTEFTQELILSNYDMSCFWANIRSDYDGFLSKPNSYRKNPVHFGWELLGVSMGADMVEFTTGNKFVQGFAAKKGETVYVYLLNKTEIQQSINLNLHSNLTYSFVQGKSMVDMDSHWGGIETVNCTQVGDTDFLASVKPMSYSRFDFFTNSNQTSILKNEMDSQIKIFARGGNLVIQDANQLIFEIYSLTGIKLKEIQTTGNETIFPMQSGCYIIRSKNHESFVKKIIIN